MNKNKKFKRSTLFLGIVVTLILSVIAIVATPMRTTFENIFRDSIATVEYYVIKKPIELISGVFTGYSDMQKVYEENEILKNQLDTYEDVVARNELLQQEINDLKLLMEMTHLRTDYEVDYAPITSRSLSGWDNEVSIAYGSNNGAKIGMAVVDDTGMLGIISETTELSSTVLLLTQEHPVNKVPVQVNNGEQIVYGLLEGYNVEEQSYIITLFGSIDTLVEQPFVYTSGLGGPGQAPAGIYIGEATDLHIQADGTSIQLYVQPAADFTDIRHVAIVTTVNPDE